MKARSWRVPWVAALLATGSLAVGCAGPGLPLDEISDTPIAIVYWDASSARKRQDAIEQMESGGGFRGPSRIGVARIESLAGDLGLAAGSSAAVRLREFPGRIVLLNPRTLEIEPFPAAPPNARPLAWSRDRKRLLFNSSHRDDGRSQLYEYDAEAERVLKLTHGPSYHLEGDYGPDGRLLVTWLNLSRDRQRAGLDVRPPRGGLAEKLVDGIYPSTPHWSPDGEQIIYVQADNSNRRRDASSIVAQAPQLGAEVDLLARGREPVFTPDGRSIVYASQTSDGWQLRRMRADGSGRAAVGRSVRDERWPAVSPDGRHVVYISNEAGIDQLYIRRIDGSGDRILLEEGSAAFPVW